MRSFDVLLRLCCLFATLVFAKAQGKYGGYTHVSITEPCVLKIEERTTETLLRTALFMGDVEAAAKIFSESDEIFSLAAGLMYTPEQQCFVQQSQKPLRDPDVVAIQAVALSAERTGKTDKLSTAIVTSFQRLCQCPLFTPRELDEMRKGIKAILDDPFERKLILEFDGTDVEPDEVSEETAENPRPFVSRPTQVRPQTTVFPDVPEEPDFSPEISASPRPVISEEPIPVEFTTTPASPQPTDSQASSDISIVVDGDDETDEDDFNVNSADGDDDEDGDDEEEGRRGRRLLVTEASPTNSLYCANCRPRRGCRPVFWCR